jgi:hypothetical protein
MGFSVVEAMKAWRIRLKRSELRRDLGRTGFTFAGTVLDDCFLLVEVEAEEAVVGPGVCATTITAHTNPLSINAKQKNLRNPTTSF